MAGFALAIGGGVVCGDDLFRDRVAPLLERHCLGCHNRNQTEGGLSLHSREEMMAAGVVEPGEPDSSYLLELVTPVDGQAEMPQDRPPLDSAELESLRRWIEGGAEWPPELLLREPVADLDWWSLRPLQQPAIPAFDAGGDGESSITGRLRIRTPIDAFVQAGLDERGLQASPEADRRTLIRRLTFDLTGLPPTPAEVSEFVADDRSDAYERLVDRLLESPRYGERWARHWLDVVHYADTHGYDKDKPRSHAWPYRDYVIRAFNDDRPYSRFVQEQIAGDALWPETRDGIEATGFLAAGPWDFIGHVEVPETKVDGMVARNLDRDDMVSTVLNTFASTTVQCARCHDHKFDPIRQEHYYSLQAVFAALDRTDREYDSDPAVAARRREWKREQERLATLQAGLDAEVAEAGGEELRRLDEELAAWRKGPVPPPGLRPEYGYHSALAETPDQIKWVQLDLGESRSIAKVRLIGCFDAFNGIGYGFGFPVRFRIEAGDDPSFAEGSTTLVDQTVADFPNPGTHPVEFRVGPIQARFVRVTATRLAERQGDFMLAMSELEILDGAGLNLAAGREVTALDFVEVGERWRLANLVDGIYPAAGAGDRKEIIGRLETARAEWLDSRLEPGLKTRLAERAREQSELERAREALPPPEKVYVATVHHGSGSFAGTGSQGGRPRPIHVLRRGDVQSPLQEVGPGTIPIFADRDWHFELPAEHEESARRFALARWLVERDNPLTWRSIVNRIWQYHFGRGLVATPNDFGRMGGLPSHPELLDWLAVRFRDQGQSFKDLHRLIVTSSVYRQVSDDHPTNRAVDGDNVYLWRMERRRLTAEEIRDTILMVSGKLDETMFGPGFELFEVDRPEHSPHYEYDRYDPDTAGTHRRSIYRFIVRSQPDPFMGVLDCADSSQSVPRRDETNTALQALALLNNRFVLRMAEHAAEHAARQQATLEEQVAAIYEAATGAAPAPQEGRILVDYAKLHGLEAACRMIFNLNVFVFVD